MEKKVQVTLAFSADVFDELCDLAIALGMKAPTMLEQIAVRALAAKSLPPRRRPGIRTREGLREQIAAMNKAGFNDPQIAEATGTTRQNVGRHRNQMMLEPNYQRFDTKKAGQQWLAKL